MFDEPTAGMSIDEVPTVLDIIAAIKKRGDKTILLVEHKMDVVRSLSDRIVVLHHGRLVADGLPADVINSDVVRSAEFDALRRLSAELQAALTEPISLQHDKDEPHAIANWSWPGCGAKPPRENHRRLRWRSQVWLRLSRIVECRAKRKPALRGRNRPRDNPMGSSER